MFCCPHVFSMGKVKRYGEELILVIVLEMV